MYRLADAPDYDDHTPALVRNDPYIEPYQPSRSGFQYTPEEYIWNEEKYPKQNKEPTKAAAKSDASKFVSPTADNVFEPATVVKSNYDPKSYVTTSP